MQGLKENKLKRNKQRALPSEGVAVGKLATKRTLAAACAIWAVAVTIWSMLCRQPEGKLMAKGRLVAVSRQPVYNPWQTTTMWAHASALPSAGRQADGNARR